MRLLPLKMAALLGSIIVSAAGQSLNCSPTITTLSALAGAPPVGYLSIGAAAAGEVTFKYTGTEYSDGRPVPDTENYVIMIPSSGTTPTSVMVGWNPLVLPYLKPGLTYSEYPLFTVGQAPGVHVRCRIDLLVPPEPVPAIQSVVNSASLQPLLSPGAMVSIFGSHLTGPALSTNYDLTASYPTSVAGTSVTFNGVAAPLLYISPGQINAIVPFAVAGQTSVKVVVVRSFGQIQGFTSDPFTAPLQDTSPAIFTSGQNGTGQGAILQQGTDGQFTYNGPANPARSGTALAIFATGMGMWAPPPQSDLSFFGGPFKPQPVSVTIGGQPAKVLYAGTVGVYLTSWSVLQVNAIVPDGVGSGPQAVVLKIGANDNSSQRATVAVQ
jgi:uncharacterized protein (TIGR03437 family)